MAAVQAAMPGFAQRARPAFDVLGVLPRPVPEDAGQGGVAAVRYGRPAIGLVGTVLGTMLQIHRQDALAAARQQKRRAEAGIVGDHEGQRRLDDPQHPLEGCGGGGQLRRTPFQGRSVQGRRIYVPAAEEHLHVLKSGQFAAGRR